jgi:hypothetical protein
VFNNWAIFGSAKKEGIIWCFGSISQEIKDLSIGFLKGLHDLGKELFDKGIASLQLSPSHSIQTSNFWGDELFIINLEGSYFLIISDPITTIKMIEQAEIPLEMDFQIRSVLVGQASSIYANMCSSTDDKGITFVDRLFQTALDEFITPNDQKKLGVYVTSGSVSLSGLTSLQCLVFHYLLRQHFNYLFRKGIYASFISRPWALVHHINGVPIKLSFEPPRQPALLSGLFSLVNNYTKNALNGQLESLIFGDSAQFTSIDVIHGQEHYLMSFASPFRLFKTEKFLNEFNNLKEDIIKDLTPGLIKYIASKISEDNEENLRFRRLNDLLNSLGGPKI